jgi:hypothetical protein
MELFDVFTLVLCGGMFGAVVSKEVHSSSSASYLEIGMMVGYVVLLVGTCLTGLLGG